MVILQTLPKIGCYEESGKEVQIDKIHANICPVDPEIIWLKLKKKK